ncbi:uncharacterized protein PSFLO_07106 [Pseudozyma flocculosa]|nr:uncharacterized protein PSFLO_07106 [Pseudozyma flocculosa]
MDDKTASSADHHDSRRGSRHRPVAEAPRFGVMWEVMRTIGDLSLPTFFSSVAVEGLDNVPPSSDPLIICSTHHNTILDVAILSSHMPGRRPLHFWAKSGLFVNPISNFILTSSGNIKVDRRHKNNQALFQGTFHAMNRGGAIALFPEGGSYSNPALTKLKAGAAWAALEYTQHLRLQEQHSQEQSSQEQEQAQQHGPPTSAASDSLGRAVKILPAAIVYSDKSRFRSRAILRFGKPITLDAYVDEFLSSPVFPGSDGSRDARASSPNVKDPSAEPSPAHKAVARLTAAIQAAIEGMTFNAPDWESFQAVRAARELIWNLQSDGTGDKDIDMRKFVAASNALLAVLTLDRDGARAPSGSPVRRELSEASRDARRALFAYACLLRLCDTDSRVLSLVMQRHGGDSTSTAAGSHASPSLPEPRAALAGLFSAVKSLVIRLPYLVPTFLPTLLPTYLLPSRIAHHFAKKEEESLSSVKTLVGFGFSLILYLYGLVEMTSFTRWNPSGFFLGAVGIWWMVELNRSCVDTAYSLLQQCRLAWAVWRASGKVRPGTSGTAAVPEAEGRAGQARASQDDGAPAATSAAGRETFNLFFYGTLVHPQVLSRVIGNDGAHLTVQNGILPNHALCHIKGQDYPGLVKQQDLARIFPAATAAQLVQSERTAVKGTVVCGLTAQDLRCLDTFEDDEYTRKTVAITLDPASEACSNAARLARGDAELNLESILAALTPARISQLLEASRAPGSGGVAGARQVEAQVYMWTASLELLEAKVWEFDEFAREKAKNWVGQRWEGGEAAAEMEFEYEIVDAVRGEGSSAASSTSVVEAPMPDALVAGAAMPQTEQTDAAGDEDEGDAATRTWHGAAASTLSSHGATREAIALTLSSLSKHPSIQYYVDQAFCRASSGDKAGKKVRRPSKMDAHLVAALYASRFEAKRSLQRLVEISGVQFEDERECDGDGGGDVEKAMRVLWDCSVRADVNGRAGWPFEVVDATDAVEDGETKKDR